MGSGMNEKQHFKLTGETEDGKQGLYHYEVERGLIVRQVCVVGGKAYWADEQEEAADEYGFPDQPEFDPAELPDFVNLERISKDEFDTMWAKGKSECP